MILRLLAKKNLFPNMHEPRVLFTAALLVPESGPYVMGQRATNLSPSASLKQGQDCRNPCMPSGLLFMSLRSQMPLH
jgi:hypothetical protein